MNIYPDFEEYNVKEPEYDSVHSVHSASNTGALESLLGMQIIQTQNVPEFVYKQFRFPKSKRKRIRNKFKKNNDNYRAQVNVLLMNGKMVMHPNAFSTVSDSIKKQVLNALNARHKAQVHARISEELSTIAQSSMSLRDKVLSMSDVIKRNQTPEHQKAQSVFYEPYKHTETKAVPNEN